MGIELLENKGFAFLNTESINQEQRQIVVIGTARGGTSLVAGSLHHLGIFTGEKSNQPVFEDVLLSEAFEQDDIPLAKSIAEEYSKKHDVWAWKRPAAINYLEKIEAVIPNPFYIFIFKDIFAIANRNSISMQADIGKGLQNALADYSKIVNFVSITNRPIMLVSAEKALQNKGIFIDALIEMNKEIKDYSSNRENAIEFITPNPSTYLDTTRTSKSIGTVDTLSRGVVGGWAKSVHHNMPVEVEIYADDELVKTISANGFRQDLMDKKIHPEGKCAFYFNFSSLKLSQKPVKIDIKVSNDISFLKNGSKII